MAGKYNQDGILDGVRDLIRKAIGNKTAGKDNIVFRIKLFAELLDGDQKGGWLLNQILYWSDRTQDPDGWFWKTYAAWYDEVGLTEREVRRIVRGDKRRKNRKKTLQDVGIEAVVRRAPTGSPTVHYRVDAPTFLAAFTDHLEEKYGAGGLASDPTSASDGKDTPVRLETDQRVGSTAYTATHNPCDSESESQKESSPESIPHHPPDDKTTPLHSWKTQFGKTNAAIEGKIDNQIKRLGCEKFHTVAARCAEKGGRSWFYVLKALENEPIIRTEPVRANGGTGSAPGCDGFDRAGEATYAEQRARARALEDAHLRRLSPPLEPTERVQRSWPNGPERNGVTRTVQDAWDLVCRRMENMLDRASFTALLDEATLVDFDPTRERFIVVVRQLHAQNTRYQLLYNTICHVLREVYGSRRADLCLLTRAHWLAHRQTVFAC